MLELLSFQHISLQVSEISEGDGLLEYLAVSAPLWGQETGFFALQRISKQR